MVAIIQDDRICDDYFFIYMGSNHIAIHEIINGNASDKRLLLITI